MGSPDSIRKWDNPYANPTSFSGISPPPNTSHNLMNAKRNKKENKKLLPRNILHHITRNGIWSGEKYCSIPVLANVWPPYEAQRHRCPSKSSDPLSSSSLLHLTRSRKLFHSSVFSSVSLVEIEKYDVIHDIRRTNLGKFSASKRGWRHHLHLALPAQATRRGPPLCSMESKHCKEGILSGHNALMGAREKISYNVLVNYD